MVHEHKQNHASEIFTTYTIFRKKNASIVYYQVHVLDDTFKSSFEDNELNSVVN